MSEFSIFKNYDDCMYYYDLVGPDGKVFGRSKGHPDKRFAVYGIIDVKNNAASDIQYEIIPDGNGRYDVHLTNLCDEVILISEGLKSMWEADRRKKEIATYVSRTIRGGERLTRAEIKELKCRLSEWQTPQAMLDFTNDLIDRIGDANFFNQSGLEFIRESWTAAKFAIGRNAEKVRLVSDPQPDFELRIGGNIEMFEATEAMRDGDMRGDEYKKGGRCMEIGGGPEQWDAVKKQMPDLIRSAVQRKLDKTYPKHTQLVIYPDPGSEFGTRHEEIKRCFPSMIKNKEEVLEKFDAVWVLWNDEVFEILSKESGGDD